VARSTRVARLALGERALQHVLDLSQVFEALLDLCETIFDQLPNVTATRNAAAFA